jgi:hypothetical protein
MRPVGLTAGIALLAAGVLAGCDSGTNVAFNQRMFVMPGMTPAGRAA